MRNHFSHPFFMCQSAGFWKWRLLYYETERSYVCLLYTSVRNSQELLETMESTTQTLTIFLGCIAAISLPGSYTHLDVYKRQVNKIMALEAEAAEEA